DEQSYNRCPDVRHYEAKVKKVNNKAFRRYQKLPKLEHIYETDDPYSAGWYGKSDNEFELIKERRIRSPRTKTKSYRERIEENLNGRKKEDRIRNKKMTMKDCFKKYLTEIVQKNEETVGINAMLGPEDLVINLNKNLPEESLAGIEGRDSMLESFWESAEISQGYKRNEIEKGERKIYLDNSKTFEVDEEETWETEKDKKSGIERKDRIMVSASKPEKCCSERREGQVKVDESDDKKVAKMKEMNSMSYNRDRIEKADEFKTYHGSSQGNERILLSISNQDYSQRTREEATYLEVDLPETWKTETDKNKAFDHCIEADGIRTSRTKTYKRLAKVDTVNKMNKDELNDKKKRLEAGNVSIKFEEMDDKAIIRDDRNNDNWRKEIEDVLVILKVGKCNEIGEKKNGTDEIGVKKVEYEIVDRKVFKIRCRYQGIMDIKRDEACGWCLGSTKAANSTGKFDPDRGMEYDKNDGIVMGCKMGSEKEDKERKIVNDDRRYHINDKKMEDLPISDREGVMVVSKVGDISKHMNVIETIENEMNNPLFDPGGSTFLKTKETVLEAKINLYLNPATHLI
ncbi:29490_t:CDS:2, partial [Gigaspora margarita]